MLFLFIQMFLFLEYFLFSCIENLYFFNVPIMKTAKIQKTYTNYKLSFPLAK